MLNVILDGQTVDQPMTGSETVADIVKAISRMIPSDKSVVKVHLDGADVTGKFDQQNGYVSQHNRLEVNTGNTRELAGETVVSLLEFHGSLQNALAKAAEEFRMGDENRSNEIFAQCLDALQIVLRTSYSVANLFKIKGDTVIVDDTSMDEQMQRVSGLLDEILEAQNQRDMILIADLIEYELIPMMDTWEQFMLQIQARGKVDAA